MRCSKRSRIQTIRKWFDLPVVDAGVYAGVDVAQHRPAAPDDLTSLLPAGGKIVLITGASGAGKTTLLRSIRKHNRTQPERRRWIDVPSLRLPNRAVVNCLLPLEMRQTLARLSQVGLAEAELLLRRPARLSEGQRFRLRLAVALCIAQRSKRPCLLACDEFAVALDEVTAAVVAQSIRRIVCASTTLGLIVASGREMLSRSLQPDCTARCDFGRIDITTEANPRG